MKKNICIILSLLLYTIGMQAEVRLPGIFSDKMVLQRDTLSHYGVLQILKKLLLLNSTESNTKPGLPKQENGRSTCRSTRPEVPTN